MRSYRFLFLLTIVVSTLAARAQSISPSAVTLKPSQTQLFSVKNPGKNVYSWTAYPYGLGTISAFGQYTAPATITSQTTVSIYASCFNQPTLLATVTLMPNVSITVAPTSITLTNGQSAPFTASVTGTTDTAYTWSTPSFGSINSSGTYTVPMTLTTQQSLTLTATSHADPSKTASASINLIPTVSVALSPTSTSLTGGQTTNLNGTVYGTTNTAITWSMSPQVGTLGNGWYTAPSVIPSAQTVTITATSQAVSSRTASVVISLVPVTISMTPASASLSAGQQVTLNATVGGSTNTAINWTVSPAVGSVSNGVYTAPTSINSPQTVTVTAASAADPSKTASAIISLAASVSISITPSTASLTGGQSTTFKATVSGTGNTGVNWSMSPSVGQLAGGVYTAPATIASAQTVTVTATSAADSGKSASAKVSLVPVSISVTPTSASLTGGQSTTLKASVSGSSDTGVNWSLSPSVGTIANGVYTAPAIIASAQTITVTATSVADSARSASAKISLTPVSISISPATASLSGGQSKTFTVTLTGTSNSAVNWSLSPSVGTIANGVYTAPATVASAQTVTVTATSAADPSKSDSATVSLTATAVSISVSPTTASLTGGQSTTFSATLSGTSNAGVNWSLSPSVGTLNNGAYTAPAVISSAQTVTVTATSAADSTKSAQATISLVPVSIRISPATISLTGGQNTTFTATLNGTSNAGVNWSMSPSVGTLNNGVYTAPATISSAQTVTITAASAADATKTASASVSLVPPAAPVSISVTPATASLTAGQSVTLTATVSGTSNLAVNWSVAPQVGTVTNGVYTAPSQVITQQQITVAATSAADPTKVATAVITLMPTVSITVTPSTASLSGGQTVQLSASLSGTSNPNVNWTLSPAVGSVANGLYQAPATISTQQVVTVTAISLADQTKTASATITLLPSVGIALTPSSISLTGGQSAQFNVTIGGTATTAVTWTLAPSVGTITNGVYTAPVTITALQTIILTVASIADATQTAQSTITLNTSTSTSPSVSPSLATLNPSQTQQFTATGLGTNPKWTINPTTGSITAGGLYTAPSIISSKATITVTATNATDSTKKASASVTLSPSGSQGSPPPTTITLPIEVLGSNGTTHSVSFNIPSGTNLSGLNLWMKIHGLRSQTQASLQLNGGSWQPISEGTVTLLGNAEAYGGIGGGFHTIEMTMPAGNIQAGTNTLTFRFNQTDGRVSGFRVLEFNVQESNGNSLIPSSAFVWDDPNSWQPPSSNASDIAAGQSLWRTAPLTVPSGGGTAPIKAHCMDCHTQDGRDLKYFNYSNNSIQARSVFHGLTAAQGNQIASYIRSLDLPNPGRPWNPPYQPGAGLDSQPVDQWAAGAGLDAVLASDADLVNVLFPTGVQTNFFSPTGVLNIRETPIALQLPDWNSWLPMIHPMDAWSDFLTNDIYTRYIQLRGSLQPNNPASYAASLGTYRTWGGNYMSYIQPKIVNIPASSWTTTYIRQISSVPLWAMVKSWELNQEFGLEGMAKTVYPNPMAESRAWLSEYPFLTSPNMLHLPVGSPSFENGNLQTWMYDAHIWYQLQLVLNNSEYQQHGASPIDWGYVYGFIFDLSTNDSQPQTGLLTLWMTKALQISNNGLGPAQVGVGWNWLVPDISRLVSPGFRHIWTGTPLATRSAIENGFVQGWLAEVTQQPQFAPQQFWAGNYNPARQPVHGQPDSSNFEDRVWYMIPQFRYFGVSQTLINQLAAWAKSIWTSTDWTPTTTATCLPDTGDPTVIRCSTDK